MDRGQEFQGRVDEALRPHPKMIWQPLKGAIKEAHDIKLALQGSAYDPVKIYEGPDALAEVFRFVHGPRILHVATHGYFLPNPKLEKVQAESDRALAGTLGRLQQSDDPLQRSGLVFAGANLNEFADDEDWDREDGWVTAADVSQMDLTGTALVVLSACDAGLGDVKVGDGIQGLQQAFLTAGAHSLIMTLYELPDEEAAQMMRNFYALLANGEDTATALHKAQLSVISERRKKYGAAHPYFWASFVFVGQSAGN
jgi:CHAT domain-containing protein